MVLTQQNPIQNARFDPSVPIDNMDRTASEDEVEEVEFPTFIWLICRSLITVAHSCYGKTYFSTAKLTFSRQNFLFQGFV